MKKLLHDYFKGCLFFTAGSLYRNVERMAVSVFSSLGIAPIHAFILMAVADALSSRRDISPSDLAGLMGLDKSTVTRHLHLLERKGFILRIKIGRRMVIKMTKEGQRLLPKIELAWSKLYGKYCSLWGETRANAVNDQIYKLISSEKKSP